MERSVVIAICAVIAIIIAFVVLGYLSHRCAICGNIHLDYTELKRCKECGKLFCHDKATKREIVKSSVKSVLGSGIHTSIENNQPYKGKSCGYIFISTNVEGSTYFYYCHIHEHLGKKHS